MTAFLTGLGMTFLTAVTTFFVSVAIFLVAFLTVLGTVLVTKVLVAFQAFVVVFLIDCTTGLINLLFIFLAVLTTGLMIFF